jgi:autotransporter adhesin
MNKIYSKVWNASLNQPVVASELAAGTSADSKKNGSISVAHRRSVLSVAIGAAVFLCSTGSVKAQQLYIDDGSGPSDSRCGAYNEVPQGATYNNFLNAGGGYSSAMTGIGPVASANCVTPGASYVNINNGQVVVGGSSAASSGSYDITGHLVGFEVQQAGAYINGTSYNQGTLLAGNVPLAAGQSVIGLSTANDIFNSNYFHANSTGAPAQATGTNSTASGANSIASGNASSAYGYGAIASGDNSVALGTQAMATQTDASAVGDGAQATGAAATAVGAGSKATATQASALGNLAQATGLASTAVGSAAMATQTQASALGNQAQATGLASTAVGATSMATQSQSSALGYNAMAMAVGASAFGTSTMATSADATAVGFSANATASSATAVGYNANATGLSSTAVGNAAAASGPSSTALGYNSSASGNSATAMGDQAAASGLSATAIGYHANASGDNAIAEGTQASATNYGTTAIGYQSSAAGIRATALGFGSSSLAQSSVTFGDSNTVKATAGQGSIAGGYLSTVQTGVGAVAMGYQQTVSGDGATAIGANNVSNGTGSVAIGIHNDAEGTGSVALGQNATAGTAGQNTGNVAIGNGTTATTNAGDVALGSGSATGSVTNTKTSSVNGITYGPYAGTDATSTVSIGNAATGMVRTLTNVAAGQVTAASTDAVNGSQLYALQEGAVQYDRNSDGSVNYSSVTLGNNTTQTQIHNLANGTATNDAVNLGQLRAGVQEAENWAKDYTDRQFQILNQRANAGIAASMAMAGLPQAYQPHQRSVAVAMGGFHGEAGIAIGVSTISESGRWVYKLNVSDNSRGDAGVSVGAAMVW